MRFCSKCSYYLYLKIADEEGVGEVLNLTCYHCGYTEKMEPKSSEEALILETNFGEKAKRSVFNEFTKRDPTLPRLKTIPCPNPECASQGDPDKRSILYIKTDAKSLAFQYCCTVCDTQWTS